jgi:hypothetical protein
MIVLLLFPSGQEEFFAYFKDHVHGQAVISML